MVTFAICGCGNRGLTAYTEYQKYHPDKMKVVAGADIRPERIKLLQEMYQVPASSCFASDMELLSMPKLADVMLISTPDRLHVKEALAALDLGYDILHRNFTIRGGEIDIVAIRGKELACVEVKTRKVGAKFDGEAAITYTKKQRLIKTARAYLHKYQLKAFCRFDVAASRQWQSGLF